MKTPYEWFLVYISLKTHFSDDKHDYVDNKAILKTRKLLPAYQKRHDRHFFEKLAKHEDPFCLLLSNFSENANLWIGDVFSREAELNFKHFKSKMQSFDYMFKKDMAFLQDCDLFKCDENSYPEFFMIIRRKKIMKETAAILEANLGILESFKRNFQDDVLFIEQHKNLMKYGRFFPNFINKYDQLIRSSVSGELPNKISETI